MDNFLTVQEVASQLGISIKTVKELIYNKEIEAFKIGRGWKISTDEVQKYIQSKSNLNEN